MSIEEFIKLSEVHAATGYGNPASVAIGNNAADKMKSIATHFGNTDRVNELLALINHESAGSWVAYSVAELECISSEQRETCISKIQGIASGSSIDSAGAEHWLKDRGHGNI